ncbi:uncharacterized protein LOC116653179 [Coturnix japonica]|uniref:uncharacterized protein LOC116653179 n=1 Tax=Coturnix japonica TaxID=93934 RepID=UPI0013A5D171|nr:uncharacterized protein LOC116653179 [Coturnix japonica]
MAGEESGAPQDRRSPAEPYQVTEVIPLHADAELLPLSDVEQEAVDFIQANSISKEMDLVQKLQFLNSICILCSTAGQKGLTLSPNIFCLLKNLCKKIEVRGHGTQVAAPCEKDRTGGEGGREMTHRHPSAPDGTPGAAESSAVEVDSSTSVPVFVKGHWGDSGPSGRWQVCCCWVLAAARCHPDCALQVLLCEEPMEKLVVHDGCSYPKSNFKYLLRRQIRGFHSFTLPLDAENRNF